MINDVSLTAFKDDVVLFTDLLSPIFNWFGELDDIFAWKQPVISAVAFFVLMWLAYHDLQWSVVPLFLLSRGVKLFLLRIEQGAMLESEFGDKVADITADEASDAVADDATAAIAGDSEGSGGKEEQKSGFHRLRQLYTQLDSDLRQGKDKAIAVHRFIHDKNTVLLKFQTLHQCAVPKLSLTFATALVVLGALMFVIPFRFFFMVLVLHLFTKDMYFRKDPSPIDRFYDAVPIRSELDDFLEAHPQQLFVLKKQRLRAETSVKSAY